MNVAFFTGMPGWLEILLVLFAILLLFGGKKLPELARSLGKSLSEFRKGRAEGAREEALASSGENEQPQADAPAEAKDEQARS